MRKPSVGIIIFGIVFVLCGLRCLSGAVAYFAYREITPYIYKALEAKSNELEKLLQEKESTQGAKVIQAQKQLQTIKQDIQRYRERYVKGKMAPWSTLIFVIISFVAAGIFCYTGIAITITRFCEKTDFNKFSCRIDLDYCALLERQRQRGVYYKIY